MFRVVGALVLMVGAVAGVYLGLSRSGGQSTEDGSFDVAAHEMVSPLPATPLPTVDVSGETITIVAQAKAAAAAAEMAQLARRAEEVADRERREKEEAASRSESRLPVPSSCDEYSGNRALGCALLLDAGFGLDQMPCLDKLWTKESGWNERAQNKSSGAYGIPQALPGDKMAKYGSDWKTNPVPQIKWGLAYIEGRYDTPCGAWSFFQAHNWY